MLNASESEAVKAALSGVGLNDVEASIYQTALQIGPRPASVIAKRAGLGRARTYDVLEGLRRKGVVREIVRNKVKHFSCCPPEELVQLIESRQTELAKEKERLLSTLPVIEKMARPLGAQLLVETVHGSDGLKRIFQDTLKYKKPIYAFVGKVYSSGLSGDAFAQWRREYTKLRAERGIWYYGIVDELDEHCEPQSEALRDLRVAPGVNLPVEIIIYGTKVAIISSEKVGLMLDNKDIAEALLSLHQALWAWACAAETS